MCHADASIWLGRIPIDYEQVVQLTQTNSAVHVPLLPEGT